MLLKKILKFNILCFLLIVGSYYAHSQSNLSPFEANKYIGKYKLESKEIVAEGQIRFENDFLYFYTEGIPEVKLIPEMEEDQFKTEKYEIKLQFIRDDFSGIDSVKIWFQGKEFIAKKTNF